jgi:hypothetical protein
MIAQIINVFEVHNVKHIFQMTSFCDIAPCSLAKVGRLFSGAYCLHQGDKESAGTSEKSVIYYETTQSSIPKSYHLVIADVKIRNFTLHIFIDSIPYSA